MFFDFHVNNDLKLVEEAERLGYAGLTLFKEDKDHSKSGYKQKIDDGNVLAEKDDTNVLIGKDAGNVLAEKYSIRIYKGVLIQARNPEDMRQKVKKSRKNADVIMVPGGDQKMNRAACEDPQVDVLSKPYFNRRDCGINHVMAKKAAQNGVAIELNIKYLTKTSSYLHYKVLSHFREIIKLKRKYNFPVIITSDADSIYDLHTPKDLVALSRCFGMKREEAENTLSQTPMKIIEKSSTRNEVIVNGVKVVE